MSNANIPRLYEKMSSQHIDALVVIKPEFFYYVTGFQNHMGGMLSGPGNTRQLSSAAIIPIDEKEQPTMLIGKWEEVPARESSWIKDVRSYQIWIEIFHMEDFLKGNLTRVNKPTQYDMKKNAATIAEILREKRLSGCTIGIEFDYISQNAISVLREELPQVKWVDSSRLLYDVCSVKTDKEIKIIEMATRMAQDATLSVAQEKLEGLTVGEVRLKYQMAVLKIATSDPSVGYQDNKCTMSIGGNFAPKTVNAPYRSTLGDIIFIDPGVMLKGYMSDIGRSMVIGKPNDVQQRIYSTLILGLESMLAAIKPGVKCSEIFHIGQESVRNAGTGLHAYTRGQLGHAVGLGKGERPPFIASDDHTVIEPGMVFSIEAPLYIHGIGGFNIEDTIVVNKKGYDLLCDWPRELIQVR
jgi:Xaa-Pro dipeptidase